MARTVDLLIAGAHEVATCRGPADGVTGEDLRSLDCISDGAVAVDAGRIVEVGASAALEHRFAAREVIDATGRLVSPGVVDSHTHLVHAGSRHDEWEARVTGVRAPGIAGGIQRTVRWTHEADDAALLDRALADLDVMAMHGTTTVEAKTGYGLSRDSELRLLRLTAGLRHAVEVVPTFLGAHVLPAEYADRRGDYVDLVVDMLAQAAAEAAYCDVCCDPIGFTEEECRRLGEAARDLGMGVRLHADQTGDAGGATLAARLRAASADHLDHASEAGFRAMAEAGTVATLLPGVTHHMLEMTPPLEDDAVGRAEKPFMPRLARTAVDAGGVVALATDYNPGTCPTPSMQAVMQLAARLYRLGYAENWHMCTINAAAALGRGADRGSLEPGKRADIVIWDVAEHGMVIHRFGVNLVDTLVCGGRVVVRGGRPDRAELRRGELARSGDTD